VIIRFRRLLSLPLNLGRLRLCRSARGALRRGRVSSVSRRRIRVRLHSRLFLALLRARALSPRLSRARRAPGFPFSPRRVIRRPSQLIIRNRREYRILRVPSARSRHRTFVSHRAPAFARVDALPHRAPLPARGDHPRARSSHRIASRRIRLGRTNPVVFPSTSDPSARTTATVVPRSGADVVLFITLARVASPRARRSNADATSGRRRRRRRRARPRAPVGSGRVGRSPRAPDPSGPDRSVGRRAGRATRACIFHGRARGGVHYDDSWPSVLGIKKRTDGRHPSSVIRHPRGRMTDVIRGHVGGGILGHSRRGGGD